MTECVTGLLEDYAVYGCDIESTIWKFYATPTGHGPTTSVLYPNPFASSQDYGRPSDPSSSKQSAPPSVTTITSISTTVSTEHGSSKVYSISSNSVPANQPPLSTTINTTPLVVTITSVSTVGSSGHGAQTSVPAAGTHLSVLWRSYLACVVALVFVFLAF